MFDESISQAEIDALVRGIVAPRLAEGKDGATVLLEPLREFAQHAGRALSELAGAACRAELAGVSEATVQALGASLTGPALLGRAGLNGGLTGTVTYVVPESLGLQMITQIYGGVAPSALDVAAMAAFSDGLSQMTQAGIARLTDLLGRAVYAGRMEPYQAASPAEWGLPPELPMLVIALNVSVGDGSGRLQLLLPPEVAAPLLQAARERVSRGPAPQAGPVVQPQAAPPASPPTAPAAPFGTATAPAAGPAPAGPGPLPGIAASARQVAAATAPAYPAAQFPDFTARPAGRSEEMRNIDLLMDVTLQVTVELGRTRKRIKDVLSLGPGSVVELDKLAGEQVDVLVNGKLIAKGEVVVIDENFGVRITDIISQVERVQSLK